MFLRLSSSDKLEAYQIELEYGSSIRAYQGELPTRYGDFS